MRNSTRILTLGLVVLALAASPGVLNVTAADKTQDALLEIQRDISSMQGDIQALQKTQADQITQMKMLLQQAVDASTRASQSMEQEQRSLADNLTTSMKAAMADQQTKLTGPMADLNNKVNDLSQNMTAVQTQVSNMSQQVSKVESKLNDVYNLVNAPPVAPPPADGNPGATTPSAANGAPPGTTPTSLRAAAERDYAAGNSLAMSELADYVKYFHDDAWAPTAQFHIAELYDAAKQYDDSADAYDAVVTRFPTNNMTAQAAYMKGAELIRAKHLADAREQMKDVESTYPGTEWANKARDHLRTDLATGSGSGSSKGARRGR